ncbi:hypothetical protein HHK36_023148 [Tetracentron sinense]|uniref:Transglutaminase-like domain-containing protein n=1 Tax=Tetracentron sinense TaxID=13715 RepID=A0A834YL00_TETSI|nr:hypothetical protein HHK36_023148 [Tetracentron sinense]
MVARKLLVHHNDSQFDVDYDTDDGFEVLKFQLFSLTSVPPDDQKIFVGKDLLVTGDSDLNLVSDKLRLVSINDEVKEEESAASVAKDDFAFANSDEELARLLQASSQGNYEDPVCQEAARNSVRFLLRYIDIIGVDKPNKVMPAITIRANAAISMVCIIWREGNVKPSKVEQDHAFLLQLLFWFKQSFRWVNAPPCDACGSGTTGIGMGIALPSEIQFGGSRVELYRCNSCSKITRFPRYNDPLKIVETRRGRCGEWANCFTLYCRAFGYESRLILDFTDHLWTECFSHFLGRWMHLDPCEGVYDNPLLYEKGWNKNLSYVIAVAKDGVHDVTKRYTRKWHEVLSRRNITTEPVVSAVLSDITKERRTGFTSQALSILEVRDRTEAEVLERDLHSRDDASKSLPGRQSGAKEWRIARSELSSDENNSLSCSSCPVRICVDDHVTSIYNAFCPLLSQFVENGLSRSGAFEVLKMVKRVLLDLQSTSFRVRKASINSGLNASQFSVDQIMPAIAELLDAVSLKSELKPDGRVNICLAGDPVKTSIALPVVLDALDDVIFNLNSSDKFDRNSLSLPLLKLNRISSGSVLASGEELPFGIVTSAFDGIRISKWEEPNGAKGCWIIYKLMDGQMRDLEAYELMSANDAPERDPMDWVLEGSDDGGSIWHVLDKQTSQTFENRFQHKTYRIESPGHLFNAFRFRFLAVRDVQATSRLQIGGIDLYARAS